MVLSLKGSVKGTFDKKPTIENTLYLLNALKQLLPLTKQTNMAYLIDAIFPKDIPTHLKPDEETLNQIRDSVPKDIAEEIVTSLSFIPNNDDKLLYLDLCRLCVDDARVSEDLLGVIGAETLSFYRKEHQAFALIESQVKTLVEPLFHRLEFSKWRKLTPEERPDIPADLELKEREGASKEAEPPAPQMPPQYVKTESGYPFMSPVDYSGINDILKTVNQLGINELVIRKGDQSIVLNADSDTVQKTASSQVEELTPLVDQIPTQEISSKISTDATTEMTCSMTINSPLVGQFYSAPVPGKPVFVNVGDTVKAGKTVCIVEAMKLINEINAPADCKIVSFLVEDGANVEKDQPLIGIDEV